MDAHLFETDKLGPAIVVLIGEWQRRTQPTENCQTGSKPFVIILGIIKLSNNIKKLVWTVFKSTHYHPGGSQTCGVEAPARTCPESPDNN